MQNIVPLPAPSTHLPQPEGHNNTVLTDDEALLHVKGMSNYIQYILNFCCRIAG
jgi:hypothetical protein